MQYIQHQPILINDLIINFQNKYCLSKPFTTQIYYGSRIGVIGRNGCGKSNLIKLIAKNLTCDEGSITIPEDVILGYIPQLIMSNDDELSGGQRFNKQLSKIVGLNPNLLLLDEPTNHLDTHNREALFGFLRRYQGTLITITHDLELLNYIDTIWHMVNEEIHQFNGSYHDYMYQYKNEQNNLLSKVQELKYEKKQAHQSLMQEQKRAKNSRQQGEKHIKERKWPTITSGAKARRAEITTGKNKQQIEQNRQDAMEGLKKLYIPEVIIPKFDLNVSYSNPNSFIITIDNGTCGYLNNNETTLNNINIQIKTSEKIVLEGNNGSGKSTLLKAILNDPGINKTGIWNCPDISCIGYVDQHYSNLDEDLSAIELMQKLVPNWLNAEIRNHLNRFLLRKNEEVNLKVKLLSGGEKVRLNLALIAAKPPKLLILDEVTNNIDLETKNHLSQVLKLYPGGFILVCHEAHFVKELPIDNYYIIKEQTLISK